MEDSHLKLKNLSNLIKMVENKNQAILNKIADPPANTTNKHFETNIK